MLSMTRVQHEFAFRAAKAGLSHQPAHLCSLCSASLLPPVICVQVLGYHVVGGWASQPDGPLRAKQGWSWKFYFWGVLFTTWGCSDAETGLSEAGFLGRVSESIPRN